MFKKLSAITAMTAGLALAISAPIAANALTVDVTGQTLNFTESSTLGSSASLGDNWVYENVASVGSQAVDAKVTITDGEGIDYINSVDQDGTSSINSMVFFFQPFGRLVYHVEFFEAGSSTPITLHNLKLSIKDIDFLQFFQASDVASYNLSTVPTTDISVLDNSDDSSIPSGETRFQSSDASADPVDQNHWATVTFNDASELYLTIGQGDYDSSEGGAFYELQFQDLDWSAANGGASSSGGSNSPKLAATGNSASMQALAGFSLVAVGAVLFAVRRKRTN